MEVLAYGCYSKKVQGRKQKSMSLRGRGVVEKNRRRDNKAFIKAVG